MSLASIQTLTEMSTRGISWGRGGRCLSLTNLSHSCARSLGIWEPQPPGTLRACPGLYTVCCTTRVRKKIRVYCNTFVSEDATNPTLQYSEKIIYEINAVVYIRVLNRLQDVSYNVSLSTAATTGHPARCRDSVRLISREEVHDKAVSLYFNSVGITWIHKV
jgi:hypothetical protein